MVFTNVRNQNDEEVFNWGYVTGFLQNYNYYQSRKDINFDMKILYFVKMLHKHHRKTKRKFDSYRIVRIKKNAFLKWMLKFHPLKINDVIIVF